MNILVLSDLHIDNRDNFGIFHWEETDFIHKVETIRKRFKIDMIILNGDIFELTKYSLEEIETANPILQQFFQAKDIVFIKGNHDIIHPNGLDHFNLTNSEGKKIHIEHGHNADWINGTKTGRAIGQIVFGLLKLLTYSKTAMNLYLKIVLENDSVNKIPKKVNSLKYLTYALKLLKEYDVVILGHTHKLEAHHTYYLTRKKRYINCGSCSLGRFQGIILNTETLKYELIKEHPEPVNTHADAKSAVIDYSETLIN